MLNPLSCYLVKIGIQVVEPYTKPVRTVQWEGEKIILPLPCLIFEESFVKTAEMYYTVINRQ